MEKEETQRQTSGEVEVEVLLCVRQVSVEFEIVVGDRSVASPTGLTTFSCVCMTDSLTVPLFKLLRHHSEMSSREKSGTFGMGGLRDRGVEAR